jgi:hypothetical protein
MAHGLLQNLQVCLNGGTPGQRGARAAPDKAVFFENWAFVSPVVFAHYHA